MASNEGGEVVWAYPVTVEPTPHRVTFRSGETLYAARAADAIATPFVQRRFEERAGIDHGRGPVWDFSQPISIEIEVLDAMVNFEIADHPVYDGFEVQRFDDSVHGHGSAVLLSRCHDQKVDVYCQAGLSPDPEKYRIGGGLGARTAIEFDVAKVDVSATGVDAQVRFTDIEGRLIDVRVGDRTRRSRMAALLAPVGAAIAEPRSLMLVWPTTYRWTAAVTLGDPPNMVSRWERTGTRRGQSYRSITGSD